MCTTITCYHVGPAESRQYVSQPLGGEHHVLMALVHSALVSLLTRHAQTLSHRASRTHTTLSSSDEVASILKPELTAIVLTLQGLCLIDQRAKDELGQGWMLEVSFYPLLHPVRFKLTSSSSSSTSYSCYVRKWHQANGPSSISCLTYFVVYSSTRPPIVGHSRISTDWRGS